MPKPKKRLKKPHKRILEIEADRLVRKIVILRDVRCVCPPPQHGHSDSLQPGHLITRAKKSVRWDLRNVHCQCSSCNLLHEHYAERFTKYFILEFGSGSYIDLTHDSETVAKLSVRDMENIVFGLEDILSRLVVFLDEDRSVFTDPQRRQWFLSQKEIIKIGEDHEQR